MTNTLDWLQSAREARSIVVVSGRPPSRSTNLGQWLAEQRSAAEEQRLLPWRRHWLDLNISGWSTTPTAEGQPNPTKEPPDGGYNPR